MSVSGLWPATAVDSFVMEKLGLPKSKYRKADIFADAVLAIGQEQSERHVIFEYILNIYIYIYNYSNLVVISLHKYPNVSW